MKTFYDEKSTKIIYFWRFLLRFYLFLFFGSAVVAVWAAPDRLVAARHLALLALGALLVGGLTWLRRRFPAHALGGAGAVAGLLGGIVALRFLLDHAGPGATSFSAALPLPPLHKNLTGGVQVIALPLGGLGLLWSQRFSARWVQVAVAMTVVLCAVGLIASRSAGAWLGALSGMMAGGYIWWRLGFSTRERGRWLLDLAAGFVIVGLLAWSWILLLFPALGEAAEPLLAGAGQDVSRLALWGDSLLLWQDYWWTGSGLGATTMIYSSYIYLLHVPFMPHAHNLLLQIGIEQGIVGMTAFIGLGVTALWGGLRAVSNRSEAAAAAAGSAALIGMMAHGAVEAGLYAHDMGFVLFIPLAFLVALIPPSTGPAAAGRPWLLAILPLLIALLPLPLPAGRAQLLANLGVVAQTRAELAVFEWPTIPIQDELRRPGGVDLAPAVTLYERALARDPDNLTGLRRLGQIDLALGNYERATERLRRAWKIGGGSQRPVAQQLGELAALRGDYEAAVGYWEPIDLSSGQLELRTWWYNERETVERAAAFAEARAVYDTR